MKKSVLLCLSMLIAAVLPLQSFADEGDGGASQDPQINYTTPTRMTPLVGKRCIIDDINTDVVSVLAGSVGVDNVLDMDCSNYMMVGSTAGVDVAYQPLMSVKDLEHVYAAGTPAGYVIQPGIETSSILSAGVLQMFTIETYLDGEKQESQVAVTDGSLLDLKLVKVADASGIKLKVNTTKPFNEVRLSAAGISADVISNFKIFYAFVGDNITKPATQTLYYPSASADCYYVALGIPGQRDFDSRLTDANSEDSYFSANLITSLGLPYLVVDLGEDIPANTEVGWFIKSVSLLDLSIAEKIKVGVLDGDPISDYYDVKNHILEQTNQFSLLGLSALAGGKDNFSMVTSQDEYIVDGVAKKPRKIFIDLGSLDVNLGTTNFQYAYTYDNNVYPYEECDLEVSGDMTLCGVAAADVYGEEGLTFSFNPAIGGDLDYQPAYNSEGRYYHVEGLERFTSYEVIVSKDGCNRMFKIVNDPIVDYSMIQTRPIVGDGVQLFDGSKFVLLDVDLTQEDNIYNLIDEDLSNYYKYSTTLKLIGADKICGVGRTDGEIYYASAAEPKRVGFVVESDDAFLSADLIDFYTISTYLNGKKQETHVVANNEIVSLDLITNQTCNKVRISAEFTKPFNQVLLTNAGLLDLNLFANIKVYYAYEAPVTGKYDYGLDAYGLQFLNKDNGATICYTHTLPEFDGVASVAAATTSLANAIDGDLNTYATISGLANVISTAKGALAVKSSTIYEGNGYAGFLIRDNDFLGNVGAIQATMIRTYLDEVETSDRCTNVDIVKADLLGVAGYGMLLMPVTQPFNEIRLCVDGVADAINKLDIISAFYYADTDGDGVPDASDFSPCNARSGFAMAPCGVYPVSVADIANNLNHYSHRIYLFAGYDFDGLTADKIGAESYFDIYRRDDYPDWETEDPSDITLYEKLARVNFPNPTVVGGADLYTLTNSNISNEQGHDIRIDGGSVQFESAHGEKSSALMPVVVEYLTDDEEGISFPILMQLRDMLDVATVVNGHPEDYCYFIVFHGQDGNDYYSNIKTFEIPHSTIEVLPKNYEETVVFNDVNMVIEHGDEADVTVTGKADSYAVTDSDGDSLTPLDGTAVGNDGSNIEIEEGSESAEGLFATTDDNKYGAMVFENNSIGDHNSYALPPAETDVPKLKFNYAQVRGRDYDRLGVKELQVYNLDETKYKPVHFNIWREIVDMNGIYHEPINLFDDYVGYTPNGPTANLELINCHVVPGSVEEVPTIDDLTLTKDIDTYVYTHTEPVTFAGAGTGGCTVTYVARLYSLVVSGDDEGPSKVKALAGDAPDAPKYVVSEARIPAEILVPTGVEEISIDGSGLNVWSAVPGQMTISTEVEASVWNLSGVKIADVVGTQTLFNLVPGVYIVGNGKSVVKFEVR